MADSTLGAIRTKVRRITRSPSTSQLTDATIDEYINTFVLYDFPEQLRLFTLKKVLTFFTEPNIDAYDTNTVSTTHPLFDFKNRYITTEKPAYIAGYESFFSQDREQFYQLYPRLNNEELVGTGDGGTTAFTGTLSALPVLQNQVTFSSIDANGAGITLKDVPVIDATTGIPTQNGNLYVPDQEPAAPPTVVTPTNTINYVTGVFSLTFPTAPAASEDVDAQTVPYVANRPDSILFFDNTFFLRPVPDQPYRIEIDVFVQPTELLNSADEPELDQWWQYIAYGASKKVFEDRMDMESVQLIMPEFKVQERLVLRRTIVNQTKERTATIYTDQLERGGWYWWGSNF